MAKIDLNGVDSIYHMLNELHVTHICCRHENILGCKSTVQNQKILVSLESGKSLNSFLLFPHGCKEDYVSYVIKGTLEALECIHSRGNRVHGTINLDSVFLDKDCAVKLRFPARISNPDLENNTNKAIDLDRKKIDFKMVGELACTLYHGERRVQELGRLHSRSLLPVSLRDFVEMCVDSSRTPTMSDLRGHRFFEESNKFDRYQEELKKLLERQLLQK